MRTDVLLRDQSRTAQVPRASSRSARSVSLTELVRYSSGRPATARVPRHARPDQRRHVARIRVAATLRTEILPEAAPCSLRHRQSFQVSSGHGRLLPFCCCWGQSPRSTSAVVHQPPPSARPMWASCSTCGLPCEVSNGARPSLCRTDWPMRQTWNVTPSEPRRTDGHPRRSPVPKWRARPGTMVRHLDDAFLGRTREGLNGAYLRISATTSYTSPLRTGVSFVDVIHPPSSICVPGHVPFVTDAPGGPSALLDVV